MKKIEWLTNEEVVMSNSKCPQPAKNYLPDWYKAIPRYKNNKNEFVSSGGGKEKRPNLTVKACVPFMDALFTGYILETWCDIYIKKNQDTVEFNWSLEPEIMTSRKDMFSKDFNINNYFYPYEFVWQLHWVPKMPLGYSMMYTHPLNRMDLPFYTLTGIMDNDHFFKFRGPGNVPFYIANGFEGIIPAGTPMIQMIPIKRDSWQSQEPKINDNKINYPIKFFESGYKKLHWQKKEYN
jgi:hypothetical protein